MTTCPTISVSGGWAGEDNIGEQETLEGRKKPKNSFCTHPSAARCVGRTEIVWGLRFDYSLKPSGRHVLSERKRQAVWSGRQEKGESQGPKRAGGKVHPSRGRASQKREGSGKDKLP
jgi:hypothetical protein